MRNIFVVGWENTGTRVICRLLEIAGVELIKPSTISCDYLGCPIIKLFDQYYNDGDDELLNLIKSDTNEKTDWCLKDGHLIMMIPELKILYPDAIFICCIREPLDICAKNFTDNYTKYDEDNIFVKDTVLYRLRKIKHWYTNINLCDYIIKLEDIVYDKENMIKNLYKFLDLNVNETTFEMAIDIIKSPSDTIGKGTSIKDSIPKNELAEIDDIRKELGYI